MSPSCRIRDWGARGRYTTLPLELNSSQARLPSLSREDFEISAAYSRSPGLDAGVRCGFPAGSGCLCSGICYAVRLHAAGRLQTFSLGTLCEDRHECVQTTRRAGHVHGQRSGRSGNPRCMCCTSRPQFRAGNRAKSKATDIGWVLSKPVSLPFGRCMGVVQSSTYPGSGDAHLID